MTFANFTKIMNNHITNMVKDAKNLFKVEVDRDEMWEVWNNAFPRGTNEIFRKRREHDCSCCHSFIKNLGNMVVIDPETLKVTTIFDFEIEDPKFTPVIETMREFLKNRPIENLYAPKRSNYKIGSESSREILEDGSVRTWNHMWFDIPERFCVQDRYNPAEKMGEYRDTRNVFKRSLEEISINALDTILELIYQNSLYRGEEWKNVLSLFRNHKVKYDTLNDTEKDLYTWVKAGEVGMSIGRIRNHSIGTLLLDVTNGVDLDRAVTAFEKMVAPANYKRPKAIFTQRMLDDAKNALTEMGFIDSLNRRFAKLDDISINDILFINRDAAKRVKGGLDIFDEMSESIGVDSKSFNKVEEVTIDKFINDILPTTTSIELFFENRLVRNNNLVSLIAPEDIQAQNMFKWGNPFSWAYSGNMTDSSIKENVKNAGGTIDADLRFSIQWNDGNEWNKDDYDAHCLETTNDGIKNEIYFGNKGCLSSCGGMLDVDIIDPNKDKAAVENIFYKYKSRMKDGKYKFFVNDYTHRGGSDGFRAEIEMDGEIYSYDYPHKLREGENVDVAEVTLKDGKFSIKEMLPSTTSSKKVWNLSTQNFVPVTTIMCSPNYWEGEKGIGHKHWFFMLDGAVNDENPNGFYNEFLINDLDKYKHVMAALGNKLSVVDSKDQLSGVGFSETTASDSEKRYVILKITGKTTRTIKVTF